MRTSSYTIYVDLPDNSEEMLLVHGYTGAYDKVSRRVATYLRHLETARPPRPLFGAWSPEPPIVGDIVQPSDQTIAILKRRGYLTELSTTDEEAYFAHIANLIHQHELLRLPNYILMPTYDCNLRCSYCFQDHMRTDANYRHLLRGMSRKMVDRIFAAMTTLERRIGAPENSVPLRNIGFFGGEPLLERSRPIIEYIITKAQEQGQAKFWAVTNGTDLHAYLDLLNQEKIGYLQITLDGPSYAHDQRRIYSDGSGSYERIARNITIALEQGVTISVRMNIDRTNIDRLPELAEEMIQRGWTHYPNFGAYTAPIHAANTHTDIKTTFSSWELDQALNQMRLQHPQMQVIDRPDDQIKHRAKEIFLKQSEPRRHSTFCGAHNSMYVFDHFGDIYACWERTGDPNIRIGHVTQDGNVVMEEQINNLWRSRNVTTNAICRKCRYALHCGGGCAVLAENNRGEFFTNYCDGYAARFRAMVAETYQEYASGVITLNHVERPCDL